MTDVLVCGTFNVETTLKVDTFPLAYMPVHYKPFGISSSPSGVGYNVARALTVLGNGVRFASLIGQDFQGRALRGTLAADGITDTFVLGELEHTPQSVTVYDAQGQRMVNTDLKDLHTRTYPPEQFETAVQGCSLAVMTNVNFSRALLALAKQAGALIATDVQTVSDLESAYDTDFMAAADVLFMSHERLPTEPEAWLARVFDRYPARVVVVGMGGQGALLGVRGERSVLVPAVSTRPVVNTSGAGDALFACFLHFYMRTQNPREALEWAVMFASYKIGENGGARGFLSASELMAIRSK